ncbi:HisA/HisF-related TIM barrel protein [Bremerella cremea]|uniref:HisA/HisF-related TIM barrel protein n=1 Tax=Bremerella cremea TaxID=1031537 RepID=UPI0031E504ED
MTSLSNDPSSFWYSAILPVIDLQFGCAVRGFAGRRKEYMPVMSPHFQGSRPGTVAHMYKQKFGFKDCYVADLNAIAEMHLDASSIEAIAVHGLNVWLDSGVGSVETYREHQGLLRDLSPYRWIVALESLESWAAVEQLLAAIGPDRFVFSLDLMDGLPLCEKDEFRGMSAEQIADQAIQLGVKSVIVLDLASVGVGEGSRTEPLIANLVARHPDVMWIGGGGARRLKDVEPLYTAGAKRVLVASALLDGRITPQFVD